MKNTILSAIIGLATFTCMAATESQTQPEVGKPAPDFSLTTGDGSQVSLKDYHGKWVVLYFYPKDFTSGCTLEAHNFQRDIAKYGDAGAVILGVSVDTAQSHKDFCAKEGLNFKLLADPDAKVSTEYGSVMDYKGQKVAALLGSANRDAEVFDRADELDVGRDPNPHLALGAGIHFCLGAPLSRLELQASLPLLVSRFPDLHLTGVPQLRPTFVLRGYERIDVAA